ncbi:hypothetical protein ACU8DI_14690 [Psychroserpens sp. BH13MA-6]
MTSRWYISIIIITLTCLGGFVNTQQITAPNQEIVVQFTNSNGTSDEAQSTINFIKQQLESAEAENIQVLEQADGQLKITYYSTEDVHSIKVLLSSDDSLQLDVPTNGPSENAPSKDTSVTCDVDVYEIQQNDEVSHLDGKLALETKVGYDRFANPTITGTSAYFDEISIQHMPKSTCKIGLDEAIEKDFKSRIIPEVRAGPWHNGTFIKA